ncbi:hypothetical protein GTA08_BOTSDO06015 [Botryosphaeria dothidea]|uniref:Clr5 domain-containing protein n=1 Tax=Botryosphaeria dothidea TaxID=55169 RepID=A0A8H4IV77_9PEZI|nr:hypothetical protein GTA08_BOTSDO06015 [Botryosphaeria dothidea]
MDPPGPPGHSSGSSRGPIQDRWQLLKDVIEHQYINEKRKLLDLAEYMKVNHNFDAGVHQYKYQFRKWNLRKNVPSDAKTHIGRCLQTRAEAGRASTIIQYKGHNVDPRKIRRHLKDKQRQDSILKVYAPNTGVVANARLACGKNIFATWSMPYGAFRSSGSEHLSSSPYASAPSPYGDITIATPPSDGAPPGPRMLK